MINRRQCLELALGAGAALTLQGRLLAAQQAVLQRAIPSTGEKLPVVGLGSSATFGQAARGDDIAGLKAVMKAMVDNGGKVLDTAPAYGASEQVSGQIAKELGITSRLFWATKVNVAGRGGSKADPAAARAQIEDSYRKLGVSKIDLIQVHNMGDPATQLGILKELKKQERVRYIGVTSTFPEQYPQVEQVMRNEGIDFVGLDYAIDNRDVEQTLLPLALEKKIGVLVYLPFGRNSLFRRVGSRPLPDWAKEFDATTWAQFFLKYLVSHPAVTAVTPSTTKAANMIDNLGGGSGRLPDTAMRKRMADYIDALPQA